MSIDREKWNEYVERTSEPEPETAGWWDWLYDTDWSRPSDLEENPFTPEEAGEALIALYEERQQVEEDRRKAEDEQMLREAFRHG